MRRILSTWFARGAFRHPTPEEFFAIANEVSGEDLTPFFDAVHRGEGVFDYAVEQVTSVPAEGAGWVGEGYDGVHIFTPDGTRIGMIRLPEICGNLCFGGAKRNRLFMTAGQSLYAVYTATQGASPG